jgi:hypothetical protein
MVYTDVDTWYVRASSKHRIFYYSGKSLIERVIQYFKGRTLCLVDDYPILKINWNYKIYALC